MPEYVIQEAKHQGDCSKANLFSPDCRRSRVKCIQGTLSGVCVSCGRLGLECDLVSNTSEGGFPPTPRSGKIYAQLRSCGNCGNTEAEWPHSLPASCQACGAINEDELERERQYKITTAYHLKKGRVFQSAGPSSSPCGETNTDSQSTRLSNLQEETEEIEEAPKLHVYIRWRFCYVIMLIGFLTFIGSLELALWWSFTRNDVSGGFTMAAYVVAVGGLPLASLQMRHNHRCQCWKKTQWQRETP